MYNADVDLCGEYLPCPGDMPSLSLPPPLSLSLSFSLSLCLSLSLSLSAGDSS